jgi:hypothetical protein
MNKKIFDLGCVRPFSGGFSEGQRKKTHIYIYIFTLEKAAIHSQAGENLPGMPTLAVVNLAHGGISEVTILVMKRHKFRPCKVK